MLGRIPLTGKSPNQAREHPAGGANKNPQKDKNNKEGGKEKNSLVDKPAGV